MDAILLLKLFKKNSIKQKKELSRSIMIETQGHSGYKTSILIHFRIRNTRNQFER